MLTYEEIKDLIANKFGPERYKFTDCGDLVECHLTLYGWGYITALIDVLGGEESDDELVKQLLDFTKRVG